MTHHRAELYGSDRVFLESMSGLVDDGWRMVTVPADSGTRLDVVGATDRCVDEEPHR